MSPQSWDRLPCGQDPADLLGYVADRTLPATGRHAATCPYCQEALHQLNDLWAPVRDWADQDIPLPHRLLATITARIRRLAQSPHHTATTSNEGSTTVTSWVLGLIASAVTRSTPGVASLTTINPTGRARGAIRYGADGIDITESGAADINVTLGITAETDADLPALADAVRRNVINAIRDQTAINTREVDISIDNLAPPRP